MVLINNEYDFKIYQLDTSQTAINRLAADMNTSSRYLFFPEGIPDIHTLKTKQIIFADNILGIITSSTNTSFLNMYNLIKDKLVQTKLDTYTDVLLPYLAYNQHFDSSKNNDVNTFALLLQTEIDNYNPPIFNTNINIYDALKDIPNTINLINTEIHYTKTNATNQLRQLHHFESISTGVHYTPFKTETLKFSYTLDNIHMSIMEIFNHIQLNEFVPFTSINNMYKILKDFVPTSNWDDTNKDTIICKVLQTLDINDNVTFNDYTTAIISVSGNPGEEKIEVLITSNNKENYVNKDILIDRINDIIKSMGSYTISNYTERNVNGIYYIPKHEINHYVMSDLIMNNPFFNQFMGIDESDKASKKKEGTYIHIDDDETGHLTVNITDQVSFKGSQYLKGFNIGSVFGYNKQYIRVRISSARDTNAVGKFQLLLSKLMVIYDNEFQNIVNYYTYYIPSFDTLQKKKVVKPTKNLKLKDIAPEIFVKGYPPKCPFQPTIIDDEDVNEEILNGREIMSFPKPNTIEGVETRNYVCNHTDAIYPGLRKNPLSNKDNIPYLPCCYVKDPKKKEGSVYRHYYLDEQLADKIEIDQPSKIITNKFVDYSKFGELPIDVKNILTIIRDDDEYEFVRKGVTNTKHSLIECIMESLQNTIEIRHTQQVIDKRKKLVEYVPACKQEMYDFDDHTIKKMM